MEVHQVTVVVPELAGAAEEGTEELTEALVGLALQTLAVAAVAAVGSQMETVALEAREL